MVGASTEGSVNDVLLQGVNDVLLQTCQLCPGTVRINSSRPRCWICQVSLYFLIELGHVDPIHQRMMPLHAERDLESLAVLEELAPSEPGDGVGWMQLHGMRKAR